MENNLWKILIGLGVVLILAGIILYFVGRGEGTLLGRLPGDLVFKRKNFSFYFPLATSLLLSVILSLVFYLVRRFF